MNGFLPDKYEAPKSSSNSYMKFEEGPNKFRVLTSAIVGWEWWIDEDGKRKPLRTKDFTKVPNEFKPEAKHFWAFVVYNRNKERVQILELTQKTIMNSITALVHDEEWGDPKEYDILVTRKGEGLETEYSVVPIPPKPFDEEISGIDSINLEALYKGEDPFEDYSPESIDPNDIEL